MESKMSSSWSEYLLDLDLDLEAPMIKETTITEQIPDTSKVKIC